MIAYNFAVLRYMHSMSNGEFVNVGIVLWAPETSQLFFKLNEHYGRISKFFTDFHGGSYRQLIYDLQRYFSSIANELQEPDFFKPSPNKFEEVLHRLIADDASCFQWSEPMSGICQDSQIRLEQLFYEFVLQYEESGIRERNDETAIWSNVSSILRQHNLEKHLRFHTKLSAVNYTYSFKMGWENGHSQYLEPISFDLLQSQNIIEKANTWSGRLLSLSKGNTFGFTAVVSPPQRKSEYKAFDQGCAILEGAPSVRTIVKDDEFNSFIPTLKADIAIDDEYSGVP